MAASKKSKRGEVEIADLSRNQEDDDAVEDVDDEMEDCEDESEDEAMNQEVQIDFTARYPEDCDFHGIKKLLQQVFLKANINLSEMTDTVISQNYIGSVIMQADDDAMQDEEEEEDDELLVLGLTTVLNLTERKNLDCVKQLQSYIEQKCKECSSKQYDQVAGLFSDVDHHIGYIINERFINIPAQVALPAFENMWKEVDKARAKKMPYTFSHYMMVCKTYKMPGSSKDDPQLVFTNPEEEFFQQASSVAFSYSVAAERDTGVSGDWDDEDTEMEPLRTVLFLPASALQPLMDTLRQNLAT